MRVLVVEDSPRMAEAPLKGLREQGYAVDHCPDGHEAIAGGSWSRENGTEAGKAFAFAVSRRRGCRRR